MKFILAEFSRMILYACLTTKSILRTFGLLGTLMSKDFILGVPQVHVIKFCSNICNAEKLCNTQSLIHASLLK